VKITLVKTLGGKIIAAYDEDKERLNRIKVNEPFVADVSIPRNLRFHKKYFSLINLVFENQERYTHIDDLRKDITVEAGYYRERTNIYGEVLKEAESISFASMDDLKFGELYSKTLDVIVKHFSFDKESLIQEVEQYF